MRLPAAMRRLKIKTGLSLISLEIEALTNLAGNKSFLCFRAQENVKVNSKLKSNLKTPSHIWHCYGD